MAHVCESCGRSYPLPPKWCSCRPYPTDMGYVMFIVARPNAETQLVDNEPDRRALLDATVVEVHEGLIAIPMEASTPPEPPDDLHDRLLWHFDTKTRRRTPYADNAEWILVEEAYEPHIEMLDSLTWSVVDITAEEKDHLIVLSAAAD